MATFTKLKLSGSTDGLGILVAATATPGTAVHTAVSGTGNNNFDEIYLYAQNNHTADVVLTVEFGGVSIASQIIQTIPTKSGMVLVTFGNILQNAMAVAAFAGTTNVVTLFGYVNRIAA